MGHALQTRARVGESKEKLNALVHPCPLCLRLFAEGDLDQESENPLTLEHIPPKAAKGSVEILTCRSCNLGYGGSLDQHIDRKLSHKDFIDGVKAVPTTLRVKGRKPFTTPVHFNKEMRQLTIDTSNKSQIMKGNLEYLKENWDGAKFELQQKLPNTRLLIVALIRIAYLKAFSAFGYGYIYTHGGQLVRNQILKFQDESIIPKPIIFDKYLPDDKLGIHRMTEPTALNAILVVFEIKGVKALERYGVCLPGPDEEHVKAYLNYNVSKTDQFTYHPVPEDWDFLVEPLTYFRLWK